MSLRLDKGKILIEGMDLSGKTTITKYLSEIINVGKIQQRTLSDSSAIYDFTVAQSKEGKLHPDLINKLYTLAIYEDLYNYKPEKNYIILQDSYFALRSYALMKQKYPNTLAKFLTNCLSINLPILSTSANSSIASFTGSFFSKFSINTPKHSPTSSPIVFF